MPKPSKSHQTSFYSTYKFRVNEKDPIIDTVRTLMDDTGTSISQLSSGTNLSQTTIRNWIDGDTRKPQHASIAAAVHALGFEFAIMPRRRAIGKGGTAAIAPRFINEVVRLTKRFIPTGPSAHHVAHAVSRFNEK